MINGNSPLLKDISVTLNPDTPEWPGDTPFTCGWSSLMGAGASVNVSAFTSSPHVGTHADAPLHVREGWSGSHELSLDAFYGPAIVVDVSSLDKEISIEDLEKIQSLPFVERLLLRTGRTIAAVSAVRRLRQGRSSSDPCPAPSRRRNSRRGSSDTSGWRHSPA